MSVAPELVAVIRVIGEDRALQAWFKALSALPENLRASEVGRLVAQMRGNSEDPTLVNAFSMLANTATCRAVAHVLRERYGV